jgi:hypothetical protein
MFSFENDHDIETVSSASEFLGDTLNVRDNDHASYIVSEEGQLLLGVFNTVSWQMLHQQYKQTFRNMH